MIRFQFHPIRGLIDAVGEFFRRRGERSARGAQPRHVIYTVLCEPFSDAVDFEVWTARGPERRFERSFPTLEAAQAAYPQAEVVNYRDACGGYRS